MPPQRQSVILDSGSSLLAFPCKGCSLCGSHIDSPFDFSVSKTAEWLLCHSPKCFSGCGEAKHCHYTQSYSEGSSIAGHYFKDVVALGDIERNNTFVPYDYIGCHTRETKLFTTQKANGIMGVSYPKGGRQTTIMDVLFGDGAINTAVFAICLADDGGILSVGGFDSTIHVPSQSFGGVTRVLLESSDQAEADNKPIEQDETVRILGANDVEVAWAQVRSKSSYTIEISEMTFNGRKLGGNKKEFGSTVVDSGTTYSYFPPHVFKRMAEEMEDVCSKDKRCHPHERGRPCWDLPNGLADIEGIPSFSFTTVGGATVEWGPRSYLYRGRKGRWCVAIDENRSRTSLLGMSFMKNMNVIFDRERDRIGFVAADCPNHDANGRPVPPTQQQVEELLHPATEKLPWLVDKNERPANEQPSDRVKENDNEPSNEPKGAEMEESPPVAGVAPTTDSNTTITGDPTSAFKRPTTVVMALAFVALLSCSMIVIICSTVSKQQPQYQNVQENYLEEDDLHPASTCPGEANVSAV
eukprot:GHVN01095235.1.p1 GENE.GHVN01095235.1~~GHVN01095235.1.p1  ORF type:complete len:575 (-),score=65.09 GHVN01095235.1:281-1855(-)